MDIKKTPKADLERERSTYFLLGLVVALSIFFVLLEWRSEESTDFELTGFPPVYIEEELIGYEEVKTEVEPEEVLPIVETEPVAQEDFVIVEEPEVIVQLPADSIALLVQEETKEEVAVVIPEPIQELVHTSADIMPEFPGGYAALARFLYQNIDYPSLAAKQWKEGRVWYSFIVNRDGSISNLTLESGVYFALDEEAERVLKRMPNWIPGRINDEKVRVKVYLPIVFKL